MFSLKRKAQVSLEFIVLFVFVVVLVSLILGVIGFYMVEFTKGESTTIRNDLAQSIINEFETYEKVRGGYEREFTIPYYVLDEYNITINTTDKFIIINDLNFDDSIDYYYLLPDINFTYRYEPNGINFDLVFELDKEFDNDQEFTIIN